MESIVSTCIYCANACKLEYVIENGKITHVLPWKDDPVSHGKPCIKGLTIHEVVDVGRITKPMIRKGKKLVETTWELALAKIYNKIKDLDAFEIFFGASGKITNEDNWIIQKFARKVFFTNNVDSCSARLCHATTVVGFEDCLGIGASPGYLDDIPELDCLLIIGSNPASNHPITFNRILKMKQKGGKLITVTPIYSETADYSDIHLSIAPGTEVVILNFFSHVLISNKSYSRVAKKVPGFEDLKKIVEKYDLEFTSQVCRVSKEKLKKASEIVLESENFGIMHGMGLTQHKNSTASVHALVDLSILKNGKIVTGRGEINVQGSGDMLCTPRVLTLEKNVDQRMLKKLWGKIPLTEGMNLIQAIGLGEVKAAFISAFNPAHSMPDLNRIHKNLKKIFLVQMDSYFNLTSRFADVILPTPLLIERTGSITSGERRLRFVKKVKDPIGLPEWKIYSRLAEIFEVTGFNYKDEKEITKEFVRILKPYRRINVEKLYKGIDQFVEKKVKFKKFIPEEFKGHEAIKTKKYPFILFTFRSRYRFLTDEVTGKSKTLAKMPSGPYFYLNDMDGKNLKLKDLDEVIVSSKVGHVKGYVKLTKRIPPGYVGAHFHFENLLVNKLFPLEFDKRTYTPNFKAVAVKIKKVQR